MFSYIGCESFLESSTPDILALCKENLKESSDSSNFSAMGFRSLS